jgi:hypothetical protein
MVRLVWTLEIPAAPGWYWCRMHSLEFITEVCIEDGEPVSYCRYHNRVRLTGTTGHWAGPIGKPNARRDRPVTAGKED